MRCLVLLYMWRTAYLRSLPGPEQEAKYCLLHMHLFYCGSNHSGGDSLHGNFVRMKIDLC